VIVAVPELPATVLMVKVADNALAGTVTLVGTVALVLLLERETIVPPVGAAVFKFTVPVEALPAVTVVGLRASEIRPGGLNVSSAVLLALLQVALMVAVPGAFAVVLMVNVADEALAGTVTLAGTVALALLLPSVTIVPPVGATLLKVTVPVEVLPEVTVAGFRETELTDGAVKVSNAVGLELL
jgi:hypothetical protein